MFDLTDNAFYDEDDSILYVQISLDEISSRVLPVELCEYESMSYDENDDSAALNLYAILHIWQNDKAYILKEAELAYLIGREMQHDWSGIGELNIIDNVPDDIIDELCQEAMDYLDDALI